MAMLFRLAVVFLLGSTALSAETLPSEALHDFVADHCVMCHSDDLKTGGLTLESFEAAAPENDAETAERMLRKLHAGMMPPSYAPQPEAELLDDFIETLEMRVDSAAAANPNPGRRTFQRLNRAEYERSVHDLIDLEVDVEALLPPDTISRSFDNIADVQNMSPTLMEGYLRAADRISREAIGDRNAVAAEATYKVAKTASQLHHVEGAPFGTRGGISFNHNFVADGEYVFKMELHGSPQGFLYGKNAENEQIEVSLNGVRVALVDIDPLISESEPMGLNLETEPIFVQAGAYRVAAAFLKRAEGPVDDVIAPIEHTLADSHIGISFGITTLPHLRAFTISGPHVVTGVSDTPSRRAIFTCRPTSASAELPCAQAIVTRLATHAYRRPVDDLDVEELMGFYHVGRETGDFENGIRIALQAILTSPSFVFRLETAPADAEPGRNYAINDLDLASRLSYFLWATAPDEELLALAVDGKLSEPGVLLTQAERMLDDPRSSALSTRFASLWLRLQDLEKLHPDALMFPLYDAVLAESMKRETELLFEHLVREDRSVLELLTADYTFVDERLAQHYGIPNVTGSEFRRVPLDGINANRRGIFGHGSMLTLTSVANRTSPVQRGKWVLEVLLGSPPPPPPPDVPDLEATAAVAEDRLLSVRERMEQHRANPTCNSCHSVIDPVGLALENFDVTGAWRTRDGGAMVDSSGTLYDGTPIEGPLDLRDAILKRSYTFLTAFTESLMTYAIGRRVEYYDMPAIRGILLEAAEHENRVSSFVLGVVESDAFRMSRLETTSSGATDSELQDAH